MLGVACDLDLKPFAETVDASSPPAPPAPTDTAPPPPPFEIEPPPPRDAGSDARPPVAGKRVFVTAATTAGSFGGLTQADSICQTAASAAGVAGRFVAWVSTDAVAAPSRIPGNGPWYTMDDRLVFASKLAITTEGPAVEIDRDERNNRQLAARVWTGTQANGTSAPENCVNYTNPAASGQAGRTSQRDRDWTQSGTVLCATPLHLYCFEQ